MFNYQFRLSFKLKRLDNIFCYYKTYLYLKLNISFYNNVLRKIKFLFLILYIKQNLQSY